MRTAECAAPQDTAFTEALDEAGSTTVEGIVSIFSECAIVAGDALGRTEQQQPHARDGSGTVCGKVVRAHANTHVRGIGVVLSVNNASCMPCVGVMSPESSICEARCDKVGALVLPRTGVVVMGGVVAPLAEGGGRKVELLDTPHWPALHDPQANACRDIFPMWRSVEAHARRRCRTPPRHFNRKPRHKTRQGKRAVRTKHRQRVSSATGHGDSSQSAGAADALDVRGNIAILGVAKPQLTTAVPAVASHSARKRVRGGRRAHVTPRMPYPQVNNILDPVGTQGCTDAKTAARKARQNPGHTFA